MRKRNCPNCGAPYEIESNKCPYCGTSYYDLSALDFTSREPFYLKIKTEMNGMPCYITQLVCPRADMSIEFKRENTETYDLQGKMICAFTSGHTLTTNITFEAATSPTHKNLCTIEVGGKPK